MMVKGSIRRKGSEWSERVKEVNEERESQSQGSLFWPENNIYSPKAKITFFPAFATCRFWLLFCSFWPSSFLFCVYFTLLRPIFSFSFLFLPCSFLFLPFFISISPLFLFPFSYFSPQMTLTDIPRGGEGVFLIYRPLHKDEERWDAFYSPMYLYTGVIFVLCAGDFSH